MKPDKTVYRGRVFDLTLQERVLPGGRKIKAEIIKHPGAALIVPLIDSEHIVMLRQFRPAVKKWLYELPAGTPEKGESMLQCGRRELREETGYASNDFSLLGKIYPVPGYSTETIYIYEAKSLTPSPMPKDEEEVIETKVFSRPEIKKMMSGRLFNDAKTICALCFCGWL